MLEIQDIITRLKLEFIEGSYTVVESATGIEKAGILGGNVIDEEWSF